jgi:MerR family transcriptional regulator/heat shock protein HspR
MPSLPVDDEDAPLYTVGQVATMLRVQQAFLRRLDQHEVVRPTRSAGGQRRYSRIEILRVQYVVELVDEGMTLAAVRRILELEHQVIELDRKVRELLARRQIDARRIAELEARLHRHSR